MFTKILNTKRKRIIVAIILITLAIACLCATTIPIILKSNNAHTIQNAVIEEGIYAHTSTLDIVHYEEDKNTEVDTEVPIIAQEVDNVDINEYIGYWYSSTYPNDIEVAITIREGTHVRVCMPGVDFASGIVYLSSTVNEISLTSAVTGNTVHATLTLYNNGDVGFDFYDGDYGYEIGVYILNTVYPATNWRDHGPFDINYTPEITDGNANVDRGDIICMDCGIVVDSSLYDTNHYRAGRCASCFEALLNAGKPQEYTKYCNGCGIEIVTYDTNDPYYSSGYCSNCYFACNSCGTVIGNPDYSQECYQYGMCESCYNVFLANQPEPNVFCPVCGWGLYATSVGYDGFLCEECGVHFLHNGTILED